MKKNVFSKEKADRFFRVVLLVLLIAIGQSVWAQGKKVSLNVAQVPMIDVLKELKRQTGYGYLMNNENVASTCRFTLNMKQVSIEQVMQECNRQHAVEYRIENEVLIILSVQPRSDQGAVGAQRYGQIIRGTVKDRDSKHPLAGANIVLVNSSPSKGCTSDAQGRFALEEVPVGRQILKVSYIGYEDLVVPEIMVGSGKEVFLNIELTESIRKVNEVVVKADVGKPRNEMATVSARSFSMEQTKRYAASISDPARMALVYAGVATGDDITNEIVIRGNSPGWMLWRMEGVEIPSPNHFAEEGATAGAVSILSANVIGKSDFYTGAFPAEYGNALSGVFDLSLRNGNAEEREYSLQAGVLGVELSAEGPFAANYNGSYLVNYRYATFSLLNNLGVRVDGNSLPNYQDMAFKLNFPTKKTGTWSLWAIGGKGNVLERYEPDTVAEAKVELSYIDDTETNMYATGLTHLIFPDNKSYLRTSISLSGNYSSETISEMDSTLHFYRRYRDDLLRNALRVTTVYNRKINSRLTLRAGLTYNNIGFDYLSNGYNLDDDWTVYFDENGRTSLSQAYLQAKVKIAGSTTLSAGAHYSYFELSNESRIEPRVGLSRQIGDKQSIGVGFGMHSRHENLPTYFVRVPQDDGSTKQVNRTLKMTHATHAVLSYDRILAPNLTFKAETYYQWIDNMPVPVNPEHTYTPVFGWPNNWDTLANIGKGRNYGLELTLEKHFTHGYYFLITSSLFNSEYRPASGKWLNTKYNLNYVNNLVAGREFSIGSNKMLGINAKVIWTGGKRSSPVDTAASIENGYSVHIDSERYSLRMADYFRIDIGAAFHIFKQNTEHILSLDLQNATNHVNYLENFYSVEEDRMIGYQMAGLIPILSYRIEF